MTPKNGVIVEENFGFTNKPKKKVKGLFYEEIL